MPYLKIRRTWEGSPPYQESKTFFYMTDEAEAHTAADAEPRGADGWVDEAIGTVVLSDICKVTQKILRNFRGISNQLLLVEGHRQQTKSKAMLAVAELPEAWPKKTGIFDLKQFLGVLATFTPPTIQFEDDAMVIGNPMGTHVTYGYADPDVIGESKEQKSVPHDNPSVEFTLSGANLKHLEKQAKVLDLMRILVSVDKGRVVLTGLADRHAGGFGITIAAEDTTVHDATFSKSIVFMVEHIRLLLAGSYTVSLADWPYGFFAHQTIPISYYVAARKDNTSTASHAPR